MAKLLSGTRIYGTGTIDTQLLIQGTTASASTNTGALQVTGGVGIGGNIAIGGALYAGGTTGTNGQILTSTGNGISWTTLSSSFNGGTITSPLIINNSTGASSTNTGALQVTNGGIGVGGSIFVGGVVTATTFIGNLTGTASTATAAATAYALANTGSTYVGFANLAANATTATSAATAYALANTSTTYVGFANQAANATTATNAATAYKLIASHTAGTGLSGTTFDGSTAVTWTLNTATLMSTSVNLAAGTQGQIPYQSAAGTTAFISSGTTGQFLQATTNGAPAFTSTGSIYVGFANLAANATTATNAATAYALANTGSTYVGFANQSVNSTNVNGGTVTATIGQFSGITTVTNTTSATSTITGALRVAGGIGTTGKVWAEQLRQSSSEVAIGASAGQTSQGTWGVAIGTQAGQTGQGSLNVAIGYTAGQTNQSGSGVAIGNAAAVNTQSFFAIAIGASAGQTSQGFSAVAIGANAGTTNQGSNSIAIGASAGITNQPASSIIINGSGSTLNGSNSGFYVAPIRADATTSATTVAVYYNPVTKELTTATAAGSSFTGGTITNPLIINNSTGASSTNTGALQITNGGAGIGGNLYAGLDGYFNGVRIGRGNSALITNLALGNGSLDTNTTGTNNIAIGYLSLNSNQTGANNVAVGYETMFVTTNAFAATAVGARALQNVSSGQYNIGIGYNAGNSITTGNSNTIIGSVSGTAGMTGTVIVAAGTIERFRVDSTGSLIIAATVSATSTVTGSLQVPGGVGIGGNIAIGGALYAGGTAGTNGQILTSTGNGISWTTMNSSFNGGTFSIQEFTATLGQTTFTVTGGYTVGGVQVFANGVALAGPDFTASDGTTVVLTTARTAGDVIRVIIYSLTTGPFTSILTITNTTSATSTVSGALQVAGGAGIGGSLYVDGTITGQMMGYSLKTNARGSVSGAQTIDIALGNFVTATTAAATTWTFTSTVLSPNAAGFVLELTNGGSAAQTWPGGIRWPGGTAPSLTAAGVDVLTFITDDGGTNWRGVASMLDSK